MDMITEGAPVEVGVTERGRVAYAALEEFAQKLGYGTKEKPLISMNVEPRHLTIVWLDMATRDHAVERIQLG